MLTPTSDSKKIPVLKILELLTEIERRKAYAELGYDGLFSFCVRELKYSDSQAYQRIQAMHAMRAVPQVKEKIASGSMNLTTVAQVQVMIRQDCVNDGIKRTGEEKLAVFESFESKTSKEVKIEIAKLRGERIAAKLSLELDEEAEGLWTEVKMRAAHKTYGSDLNCFKLVLKKWVDGENKTGSWAKQPRRSISGLTRLKPTIQVPAKVRSFVLDRDHNTCKNCGSKYALQSDHIHARAKGGSHEPKNLRALCRSCNLYFAVKDFGMIAVRR